MNMISAPDIYTSHFGLSERPFTLVPDPGYLFWSPAHRDAYAMLEYGVVTRAPITLMTGGIGVGKTTLVNKLVASLGDDITVGLVSSAARGRSQLLRWILQALGQPLPEVSAGGEEVALFDAFQAFLIAEYAQGRRVVLIQDEAQNLALDALEELRMLTNINSGKDELLQLVLVGQPELRAMIARTEMRQLAQRVAVSTHVPALDRAGVRAYIAHRMAVASARDNTFSDAAADLIRDATQGVPRLVNQLCDLALIYAYSASRSRVKRDIVLQVLDDGAYFAAGRPVPLELME